jgi:hypothetical protein
MPGLPLEYGNDEQSGCRKAHPAKSFQSVGTSVSATMVGIIPAWFGILANKERGADSGRGTAGRVSKRA